MNRSVEIPRRELAVRRSKLGTIDGLDVYLVDGEKIRSTVHIDFTCGGHNLVYPWYVPPGEIWIDDALGGLDRTATLLHEAVEHSLMRDRRWGYDRAHDAASAAEAPFRTQLRRQGARGFSLAAAREAFKRWEIEMARERARSG